MPAIHNILLKVLLEKPSGIKA